MDGSVEWRQRIQVSYAEAFKEEILHFHACVTTDTEPRTHAREGREDIRLLQQILAVTEPAGLGGEALRYRSG